MKNIVQVYHHLGLGDHIICNGLIRELCKNCEKVYCFVKDRYYESVFFMYRDEPKIELVSVKDDWDVPLKIKKNIELIKVGFEKLNILNGNFDECFYRQLGLDFSLRWDNFHVERDHQIEQKLFEKVNPNGLPYIFIHDDPSRGYIVDFNKVRKDMKIIRIADYFASGKLRAEFEKYTLFHWMFVIENAREIHCMDSAFKCLVDSLPNFRNTKLFYHRYVRGSGPRAVSSMKKDWIVIKNPSLSFGVKSLTSKVYSKIKNKLYSFQNYSSRRYHCQ